MDRSATLPRARFLLALAGASCSVPPPAPAHEAAPPPSASIDVAVASPPPDAAAAEPAPPPGSSPASVPAPAPDGPPACVPVATPKKNGVVPDDLLANSAPYEPSAPALERAARCVAALGADPSADLAREKECGWGETELLAFDPGKGRLAFFFAPEVPTAGDGCSALGALTLDAARGKAITTSTWKFSPSCEGRVLALSRFVDDLRRKGFTSPVRNLITSQSRVGVDATLYRPSAILDAPLCGWMLYVVPDRGRLSVRLVTPGNDAHTELGSFPVEKQRCLVFSAGQCVTRTLFQYPSVAEAALSPDRKDLVVVTCETPGGHNEPLRYQVSRYALPASVTLGP